MRLHVRQAAIDLPLAVSDGGRRFSGEAPEQGELLVVATTSDGRSAAEWVTCDGRGRVRVVLDIPGPTTAPSLTGRCVYLETGVGVAEALVEARYDLGRDLDGSVAMSSVTDEEGRFALAAPTGTFRLRCIKDGDAGERRGIRVTAEAAAMAEIYVEAKAALAGVLTDQQGSPMAGLWVTAEAERETLPRRRTRVVTDTEGRFLFRGLVPGPTEVQVHYEGAYAVATGQARVALPYPEVRLVLKDATVRIEGRVRGPEGQPIEGATVTTNTPAGGPRVALTDPDGRFTLGGLMPGRHVVEARADGYGTASLPVDVETGARQVQLNLPKTCSASVRIAPSDPARPVVVTVRSKGRGQWASVAGQTTEELVLERVSGSAELRAEVQGDAVVTATASVDLCSGAPHVIQLPEDDGRAELTVEAVDAQGAPVPDVVVSMVGPAPERTGRDGRTNADGRIVFSSLVPGDYGVQLREGERSRVSLAPGAAEVVTLRVDRKHGDVAGVVEQAGSPVEGARIIATCGDQGWGRQLGRASQVVARSGPDGQFAFQPENGGLCLVRAEHRSRGRSAPVTLTAGGDGARLELQPSGTISGRVVAIEDGEIVPSTLTVRTLGNAAQIETRPTYIDTPDGTFRVEDVNPGNLALQVIGPSGRGYVELTLGPGEDRSNVEVPMFTRGRVSGLVLDTADTPVAGATVLLQGGGSRMGRTASGPDGRFEMNAQPGAPVQVLVSKDGFYPTGTRPLALSAGLVTDLGVIRLQSRSGPEEKAGGVGVVFTGDDKGIRIIRFVDDSPARDAGLQVGDLIVGIGGVPYGRVPPVNWVVGLRGPAGTAVIVDILRAGQAQSYTIIRRVIGLPEVPRGHPD